MTIPKKRILCVEDDPDTRAFLRYVLKSYELVPVSTKAEALERVAAESFALCLLDYSLPDGTGEEFCKHLRIFDSKTPVLFVTATDSVPETKARSIGAQGAIRKARVDFVSELKSRVTELTGSQAPKR
jgi:DNA-binding response OmpR family regulator